MGRRLTVLHGNTFGPFNLPLGFAPNAILRQAVSSHLPQSQRYRLRTARDPGGAEEADGGGRSSTWLSAEESGGR